MTTGTCILLALPVGLCAAIQDLTADYTGSVLMFSSNGVLAARPSSGNTKVFRWTRAEGVTVYLERAYERLPLVPGRPGDYVTPYFNITNPHLSADGRSVAVAEQRVVNRVVSGAVAEWRVTWRTERGHVVEFPRAVRPWVSANGRYMAIGNSVYDSNGRLVNAANWVAFASILYPREFEQGRQPLADDGTLVALDADHNVRLIPPLPNVRGPQERAMAPIIDPSAKVIVYETLFQSGAHRRLVAVDTGSGHETVLATDPEPEGTVTAGYGTSMLLLPRQVPFIAVPGPTFKPSISADGGRILATVRDQSQPKRQRLLLVGPDGNGARRMAFAQEGYREAILCGDGRVAFATTELGRLLRIDVESESVEEILPRTPWVDRWAGVLSEGAVVTLVGGGFSESSSVPDQYPASISLGGVSVEFDGRPMPIAVVTPDRVQFQVPWESEHPISIRDPHTFVVRAPSTGPLTIPTVTTEFRVPDISLGQGAVGPQLAFDETGFFLEDGSPITLATPARYGGVLTVHLTGLDQPRTATGVPFEDGPFGIVDRLDCFFDDGVPRTPFVLGGYRPAPGRVGWHELRVSIPQSAFAAGVRLFRCSEGNLHAASVWLPFQ